MDISAFVDIPIMVIVYFFVYLIRKFITKTDKQRRFLPIIAACIGIIVSLSIYLFWPSISTSINGLNAFASGAISGTAATGSNQIYKQMMKFFTTDNT